MRWSRYSRCGDLAAATDTDSSVPVRPPCGAPAAGAERVCRLGTAQILPSPAPARLNTIFMCHLPCTGVALEGCVSIGELVVLVRVRGPRTG